MQMQSPSLPPLSPSPSPHPVRGKWTSFLVTCWQHHPSLGGDGWLAFHWLFPPAASYALSTPVICGSGYLTFFQKIAIPIFRNSLIGKRHGTKVAPSRSTIMIPFCFILCFLSLLIKWLKLLLDARFQICPIYVRDWCLFSCRWNVWWEEKWVQWNLLILCNS